MARRVSKKVSKRSSKSGSKRVSKSKRVSAAGLVKRYKKHAMIGAGIGGAGLAVYLAMRNKAYLKSLKDKIKFVKAVSKPTVSSRRSSILRIKGVNSIQ